MKLKYIIALHVTASICIYSAEAELQAGKNRTAIFIISDQPVKDNSDATLAKLLKAISEAENPIIVSYPLFYQFAKSVARYKNCKKTPATKLCTRINFMRDAIKDHNIPIIEKTADELFEKNSQLHKELEFEDILSLQSFIYTRFNSQEWIIKNINNNFVLLVPQKYIRKIGASRLTSTELDIQTGFKLSSLPNFNILAAPETESSSARLEPILGSLFMTKKDIPDYDQQNYRWYFYLMGHGDNPTDILADDPIKRHEFFETLESVNSASTNIDPEVLSKKIAFIKAESAKYQYYIAGLTPQDFTTFLDFLNNQIDTKFLYYSTCYSGGIQTVVPYLGKLYNYTIVSESTANTATEMIWLYNHDKFDIAIKNSRVEIPISQNFTNLFSGLINSEKHSLEKTLLALDPNLGDPATHKHFSYPLIRYKNTLSFVPITKLKNARKILVLNKKTIESYIVENRKIIIKFPTIVLAYSTFIPVDIVLTGVDASPGKNMIVIPKVEGMPLVIETLEIPNLEDDIKNILLNFRYSFMAQSNSTILIKSLKIKDKSYSNIIIDNNGILKHLNPAAPYTVITTDDTSNQTCYISFASPSEMEKFEIEVVEPEVADSINSMFEQLYEKQTQLPKLSPEIAKIVAENIKAKLDKLSKRGH